MKKNKFFINFVGGEELNNLVMDDLFKEETPQESGGRFTRLIDGLDGKNKTEELPPRAQICEEAAKLINGDRNKSYGDPAINLKAAQLMQNSFLDSYFEADKEINPEDEAWLNAMQNVFIKLGRIATGEFKKDSYADCIGYLGIAYELALRAEQEKASINE